MNHIEMIMKMPDNVSVLNPFLVQQGDFWSWEISLPSESVRRRDTT